MNINLVFAVIAISLFAMTAYSQERKPSIAKNPIVIKSRQQVADIQKTLEKKPGNTVEDFVPAAGLQTRVSVFHDTKRENDMNEVHDASDDVYYVLEGTATLLLGGSLVDPKEVSPGEWRSKTTVGGQKFTIRKGDLIFVPRGTPHQRTVTGKGFSMLLVKIFAKDQPAK